MSFRRIPVDANRLALFVGSAARPVAEYSGTGDNRTRTDNQARDESGHPLWTIDLGCFTEDGLVVVRVKFPSASEPSLPVQAPVRVDGLMASVVQGNQYFSASSVSAVKQG